MFGFQLMEVEDSSFLLPGCLLNIPEFESQIDINQRIKNLENAL
jgi:hypothetical protein